MECPCGTCEFQIIAYSQRKSNNEGNNTFHNPKKAGALIYDKQTLKICLVQSRGNLWGCPKGSLEPDEEFLDGAQREVKEETGINLSDEDLHSPLWISPCVVYYYVERSYKDGGKLQIYEGNDANGLVWIGMDCLRNLMEQDKMRITSHTRKAITLALETELPRKTG